MNSVDETRAANRSPPFSDEGELGYYGADVRALHPRLREPRIGRIEQVSPSPGQQFLLRISEYRAGRTIGGKNGTVRRSREQDRIVAVL
jgi:hypothetical protein